jgi:hypothetical protein
VTPGREATSSSSTGLPLQHERLLLLEAPDLPVLRAWLLQLLFAVLFAVQPIVKRPESSAWPPEQHPLLPVQPVRPR